MKPSSSLVILRDFSYSTKSSRVFSRGYEPKASDASARDGEKVSYRTNWWVREDEKYCTNRRATTLDSLVLYWSYLCEITTDFDENWSIGIVDDEYDDKSSPTPRLRRRRGQEFTFLSGSSVRLPIRHISLRGIFLLSKSSTTTRVRRRREVRHEADSSWRKSSTTTGVRRRREVRARGWFLATSRASARAEEFIRSSVRERRIKLEQEHKRRISTQG